MSSLTVDPQVTYFTAAKVVRMGRAVVVSLVDAKLPGTAPNHHMTVLFRKRPDFSSEEVEMMSAKAQQWIGNKYGAAGESAVPFSIAPWGKNSCKIQGDLCELCEYLRNEFKSLSSDDQRLPHCALFEGRGRGGRGDRRGGRAGRGASGPVPAAAAARGPGGPGGPGGRGRGKRGCGRGRGRPQLGRQEKLKAKLEKRLAKVEQMEQKRLAQVEKLGLESQHLRQRLQRCSSPAGEPVPAAQPEKAQQVQKVQKVQKVQENEKPCDDKPVVEIPDQPDQVAQDKQLRRCRRKEMKQQRKQWKQQQKLLPKLKDLLRRLPPQEKSLKLLIDGYGLMRCFKQCRRERHRGVQGAQTCKQLLLSSIQSAVSNLQSSKARLGQTVCQYQVSVWFEPSGPDAKLYKVTSRNIDVSSHSLQEGDTIVQSLVRIFAGVPPQDNCNVVLISGDRALGLAMQQLGAKVMRSRVFFRAYIKRQPVGVDAMDDVEEKEDCGFVKVESHKKLSQPGVVVADDDTDSIDDDDETPDATDSDETPDNDCDEDFFTPVGKNQTRID